LGRRDADLNGPRGARFGLRRHAEKVSALAPLRIAASGRPNYAWRTTKNFGRMTMKNFRIALLAICAMLCPTLGQAQDFPNRAIRLIVPFPPGGPNDIIARLVGKRMSEILKQPIVIENRSGQGGVVGTDAVAKSAPDGYTIGIVSAGALAISPSMEKVAYDTLKDLQPITLVAKVPEMLVVATSVPAKNMAELVALAKSQPGKLNFASSGPGSLPHLAGELFKLTAKIDIVHVPYRGAAPAVNDLLGQQVQMVFLDLPVLLPQIKAGKLRPIAVGAPERVPSAPDVPTTTEAGMPALQTENWYGMVAAAKTPPNVVAALNKAAVEAMKDPDVVSKLESQGATLVGDTPEHFAAYIASESKKWATVIKEAGVPVVK
jgi:tripartite-type tricarboxylate transporter receptor subunit TctC